MKPLRLFLASVPDQGALRDRLAAFYAERHRIEAVTPRRIKWVEPENWHLTWLFLGDVDPDALPDIQGRVKGALAGKAPVQTRLLGPVFRPNARKPSTLVCDIEKTPELDAIARALREALPEYPSDRAFKPHLTLGRIKDSRNNSGGELALPDHLPELQTDWRIDGVQLIQSHLTPQGPDYKTLEDHPLG